MWNMKSFLYEIITLLEKGETKILENSNWNTKDQRKYIYDDFKLNIEHVSNDIGNDI